MVFIKDLALQNCLLYMRKNLNKFLDQVGHYGSLLTDLPKVFHCMIHDLLIVKLQAYDFDNDFLNFICNYLSGCKQKTKIK